MNEANNNLFMQADFRLLFTEHIPRSLTCKRCIVKRVTVNGVNSNDFRIKPKPACINES